LAKTRLRHVRDKVTLRASIRLPRGIAEDLRRIAASEPHPNGTPAIGPLVSLLVEKGIRTYE